MKKVGQISIWLIISSIMMIGISCKKTEYVDKPAELKIVVTDIAGLPVSGASINLFDDGENFLSDTNAVKSGSTDENGVIVFQDLDESLYYFRAEKDGKTNEGFPSASSNPLKIGTITIIETKIN